MKTTYQITTETCETHIRNMKHSKAILETFPCNRNLTWETLLIQHILHMQHMQHD
jgi:hypothetical protein